MPPEGGAMRLTSWPESRAIPRGLRRHVHFSWIGGAAHVTHCSGGVEFEWRGAHVQQCARCVHVHVRTRSVCRSRE